MKKIKRTIIRMHTRARCDNLLQDMQAKCPRAHVAVTHARVDEAEREKIFDDFVSGRVSAVITPGACAFGVHVRRLHKVIVAEIPDSMADIVQRHSRSSGLKPCVQLFIFVENHNRKHLHNLRRFRDAIAKCNMEPEPEKPEMPRAAAQRFKLKYYHRTLRFKHPTGAEHQPHPFQGLIDEDMNPKPQTPTAKLSHEHSLSEEDRHDTPTNTLSPSRDPFADKTGPITPDLTAVPQPAAFGDNTDDLNLSTSHTRISRLAQRDR
jgi:superfamily II DNA/RNA helicase